MKSWIIAAALLCLSSAAWAQTPPPADATSYTREDLRDVAPGTPAKDLYPARAVREKIESNTTINCLADENGVYVRCVIVKETPEGYGFGMATIAWFLYSGPTGAPNEWRKFTLAWRL